MAKGLRSRLAGQALLAAEMFMGERFDVQEYIEGGARREARIPYDPRALEALQQGNVPGGW